jgi:hypothetical protein
MDSQALLTFIRAHRWAIEATSSPGNEPQAAIIGIAVTEELELVFDTLASSRKAANLRASPRIALVIGGWNDTTRAPSNIRESRTSPSAPSWRSSREPTSPRSRMVQRACRGRESPTCASNLSGYATATSPSSRPLSPNRASRDHPPVHPALLGPILCHGRR